MTELVVRGINPSNALERLRLIAFKLQRLDTTAPAVQMFLSDPRGTVAYRDLRREPEAFDVLHAAFIQVALAARGLLGTGAVLEVALSLSPEVSDRISVWLKGTDPLESLEELSSEVRLAIGTRNPTGDDLRMIDRVIEALPAGSYPATWIVALGEAPNLADVRQQLDEHHVASDTWRSCLWVGLVPGIAPRAWAEVFSIVAAGYGPLGRQSLERRPAAVVGWGQSPLDVQEIAGLGPIEAARVVGRWRANPDHFLVGPRELARELGAAVALDLPAWLVNPMQIAELLREPIHISHYLAGVEQAINRSTNLDVAALLDVLHNRGGDARAELGVLAVEDSVRGARAALVIGE